MKTLKLIAILTIVALSISSCSESKLLLESLEKYEVPIEYLHDTRIVDCDRSTTIKIEAFEDSVFDSLTLVTKINHKVLPFIVYNYEEVNLRVRLGENSIEQKYSEFFREAFGRESSRTGMFNTSKSDSDYTIEISYDTCRTESKYQRKSTVLFILLAYSMSFQEFGFPAETYLVLNMKLKKGDEVVFSKRYTSYLIQPFLNSYSAYSEKLRASFMTNMAESLSLATKSCIEEMISDINREIE